MSTRGLQKKTTNDTLPQKAPLLGIRRHCLGGRDGRGVSSLVSLYGCPLRCLYCLNGKTLLKDTPSYQISANELIEKLKIDNLYFIYTGGGVTFGGGEPLLHHSFIENFISKKPTKWNIFIETSLNVPLSSIENIASKVDLFIVDCKDMNNDIYIKYTGKDNSLVINNLKWFVSNGMSEKIKVRVPLIKGINTPYDQKESIRKLHSIGVSNIELFEYIVPDSCV